MPQDRGARALRGRRSSFAAWRSRSPHGAASSPSCAEPTAASRSAAAPVGPSTPPPPGTYTPDLTPPRRLSLAPDPAAAAPPRASEEHPEPSAAELRDLAGAIAATARRLEELATTLERSAHRLSTPPQPAPSRSGPLSEALRTGPPASSAATNLGARLVAIEMAVAGATRGEVALRLSRDFFGEDAAPILDDVFGAGSGGSTRMPWAPSDQA